MLPQNTSLFQPFNNSFSNSPRMNNPEKTFIVQEGHDSFCPGSYLFNEDQAGGFFEPFYWNFGSGYPLLELFTILRKAKYLLL